METNLTLSFTVGALANLILTVTALFFSFVPRVLRSLALAAFISAIWCLLHTVTDVDSASPPLFLLLAEMGRNGAWIHVLTQLTPSESRSRRLLLGLAHLPWVLSCITLIFLRNYPQPHTVYEPFLWISMCVAISGLVAVEQAYRHTMKDFMDALRFIYYGIGGLFVFELYFYAQTLLMGEINMDTYIGRGAISIVVPILIIVGLSRLQRSHLRFQVSRHLAFYTSSLIMTGTMLVMMAIGSFYVREFGGSWGVVIQTALLFAGTVLILTIVTSSRVRAHMRVVISKHLFRHRYDYREEWLRLIQTLTSTSQSQTIYAVSIKSLAQIFDAGGGVLWTLRDNNEFAVAANLNAESIDAGFRGDDPVITYLEQTRKVIVADEYTRYPQYYPGLELPAWMHTSPMWLIVPLLHHDKLIGIIALTEPQVLRRLSWEDFDILKTAGLQIASFLANEQTSRALLEARQFDAYSRLTAFIMHDLKNLIAQQSLVVKNAAKHKDNPAFVEDAINTIDNSVKRMSRLLDQLRQGNDSQAEKTRIHLQQLLMDAVRKCYGREPRPSLHMCEQPLYVETSSDQLSMIIGHVIRNAQDATASDGFIDVTLTESNGQACIRVEDNGIGMSQEFIRDRLFRPFDTTKSSKGMGIGAYQTREFIRQAGGNVEIHSQENVGTTFTIYLPLCDLDATPQSTASA